MRDLVFAPEWGAVLARAESVGSSLPIIPVSSMGAEVWGTVSVAGTVGATVAGTVGAVARVGTVSMGFFLIPQPQNRERVRTSMAKIIPIRFMMIPPELIEYSNIVSTCAGFTLVKSVNLPRNLLITIYR